MRRRTNEKEGAREYVHIVTSIEEGEEKGYNFGVTKLHVFERRGRKAMCHADPYIWLRLPSTLRPDCGASLDIG